MVTSTITSEEARATISLIELHYKIQYNEGLYCLQNWRDIGHKLMNLDENFANARSLAHFFFFLKGKVLRKCIYGKQ